MGKALGIVVVIVILLLAGFGWLTLHWSYSSGDRAGYVQKFSRKGFVCKTWEGELAMVTLPGTLAEKFYFTVPTDEVARKIARYPDVPLGHSKAERWGRIQQSLIEIGEITQPADLAAGLWLCYSDAKRDHDSRSRCRGGGDMPPAGDPIVGTANM